MLQKLYKEGGEIMPVEMWREVEKKFPMVRKQLEPDEIEKLKGVVEEEMMGLEEDIRKQREKLPMATEKDLIKVIDT